MEMCTCGLVLIWSIIIHEKRMLVGNGGIHYILVHNSKVSQTCSHQKIAQLFGDEQVFPVGDRRGGLQRCVWLYDWRRLFHYCIVQVQEVVSDDVYIHVCIFAGIC